jgi:LuxR family maltose regulon positive regulatory protein
VPGLIDPLTGRELRVLAMLAVGEPNRPSPATVRHRLHGQASATSLGKLGAANRTEAVARARDLGLIP